MRISDWSSDVCSSDLADDGVLGPRDRRLLGLSAGGEISMGDGTSIGRVRGLGAAKEGTHHWWHQRLTAGGNLLLVLWFVFSMARLPAYDHAPLIDWIGSPWVAIPLVLLVASVFYHFRIGLQVLIEDYEHKS